MEKHDVRDAGQIRTGDPKDPWYDDPASGWGDPTSGWGEPDDTGTPKAPVGPAPPAAPARPQSAADIYLEVQASPAFQEVRRRYRSFVIPGVAAFFTWYVAYVVTATTAPGLMARQVGGAVNVAMVAGLAQFATTFLLTWAYARHARLRRDRAALDLRWAVFEQKREQQNKREQEPHQEAER